MRLPYHSTLGFIEHYKGRKVELGPGFNGGKIKCPHILPLRFPRPPDMQLRYYLQGQGIDTSHYDDPQINENVVETRLRPTNDGWLLAPCSCGTLYYKKVA